MSDGSELGTLLADTVTRLFTDLVTKEAIEAAEKGAWPEALWRALEEGGLTLPLVPESRGGAGGSWRDAFVMVRAAGRHQAPVPLPETILASWLLAGAELDVPLGPLTVAPVRRQDALALAHDARGWRVRGTAARVPWGNVGGHVVVMSEHDGRAIVALASAADAKVVPDRNVALEPRDTLVFDDVPVLGAAPAAAGVGADAITRYGAMLRAAQMAGALESALDQAVRYAGERKQFGRPIGNFQAIQHQLAVLASQTAEAGLAAERAFAVADRGDAWFEIASAKIVAGEAAGIGARIAHQVHGAIGFTYEHSLHFATRRVWSWRAEFGSESRWAAELGRRVTARGADALWSDVTAR